MSSEEKQQGAGFVDLRLLVRSGWKLIKRFWWLFGVLAVVFFALVMLLWHQVYTPTYKSYCSFTVKVINDSTTGQINTLYGFYYDKDLADQLEKTFTYILTSDLLSDEIREQLGENVAAGNVQAECVKGSNLFVLSTFGDSPEESERLLNAVMSVYADAARFVVGELQVDMVEQPVIGTAPDNSPSTLIGAALGVMLSGMLLVLWAVLQVEQIRTVQKPEDLEEKINMPCLGLIPVMEDKERGREKTHRVGEFRESIRGIARKVEQSLEDGGMKVLLVTGTVPGEGKSTICRQLALTLADWGKTVYLLDGDLRKPTLYKHFGIKGREMPLQQVLEGTASLKTVLHTPEKNLMLVGNTQLVQEPTVLLDSKKMESFIDSLAQKADCVIIDAPPCDVMSDVTVLQRYADRVLYVVRQDYARIPQITDAVEDLCTTENKLLGYVLNGTVKTAQGYGKYGYGTYSYGKYGNGYYGYYGKGYHKYYEEDAGPSDK